MEQHTITLSLVCPAFNEEQVLPLFHRALSSVLAQLSPGYLVEIIYVDDGSEDRTLEVLRTLAAQDARVRYLSLSRNFGHQAALTAGMEWAQGEVLITLDSDLQHPPALIPTLLEHWQGGKDVVITLRDDCHGPNRLEHSLSRWFYKVMGWLSDTEIRPAAADFRLLSRPAVDALLRMGDRHRFLRGMVQWLGFPFAEVHYVAARRGAGKSKYNLRRKVRLALDGLLSFSKVPLRLPLGAGLLAGILGLGALGYTLGAYCSNPGGAGALPAFLVGSLYLLGGGILGALGILGEYLGRIYDQVRYRPLYVLKEHSHPVPASGQGSIHTSLVRRAQQTQNRAPAA
jgi:glycosyltransferase involved in cell wall biosynthesis